MKDLYTFDDSVEAAQDTYQEICSAYDRIFHRLRIPFLKGKTQILSFYFFYLNFQ